MGVIGPLYAPQKHPDLRQPTQIVSLTFGAALPDPSLRPSGLVHDRAQGDAAIGGSPGNLVHARALGNTSAARAFLGISLLHEGTRIATRQETRAIESAIAFPLYAHGLAPPRLDHLRNIGDLGVLSPGFPEGLVHTRAQGEVSMLFVGSLRPATLIRVRELGALVASSTAPPPDPETPLPEAPRTYWRRSLRGVERRAEWD